MTTMQELHKVALISSYSIHYSCTSAHMQTPTIKPYHIIFLLLALISSRTYSIISRKHFLLLNRTLFFTTRYKLCHIIEIHLLNRLSGICCFKTTRGIQWKYIIYICFINCTSMSSIIHKLNWLAMLLFFSSSHSPLNSPSIINH